MKNEKTRRIKPVENLNSNVVAPPSKAHTLRALFIASLSKGKSILKRALNAEDQKLSAAALNSLGAKITFSSGNYIVKGTGGMLSSHGKKLFLGNSGAGIRFIMPIAALTEGKTILDGTARMRKRPADDLIGALRQLGARVSKLGKDSFPVAVEGRHFEGGTAKLDGEKSSQYFSAILISAPYANSDVKIISGKPMKSRPYIDITLQCMKDFGVKATHKKYREFFVKAGQTYRPRKYEIEGDYSNASYFFAAAAIIPGKVTVTNLQKNSKQGDAKFPDVLKKMGCKISKTENSVQVIGPEKLRAIDIDMSNMPDMVPTLAIVAACASGKTKIRNVANLRIKESDRIASVVKELRRLGVEATERKDGIEIIGPVQRGAEIETYNDHRIAMAFSVLGMKHKGISIKNPSCVSKSFPDFFRKLEGLY